MLTCTLSTASYVILERDPIRYLRPECVEAGLGEGLREQLEGHVGPGCAHAARVVQGRTRRLVDAVVCLSEIPTT